MIAQQIAHLRPSGIIKLTPFGRVPPLALAGFPNAALRHAIAPIAYVKHTDLRAAGPRKSDLFHTIVIPACFGVTRTERHATGWK